MNKRETLNPLVVGSSPTRVTLSTSLVELPMETQVARFLDWVFAPAWLTIAQARFLSGWPADVLAEIISEGGVDTDADGRIEKQSLYDFQGTMAEVMHAAPTCTI